MHSFYTDIYQTVKHVNKQAYTYINEIVDANLIEKIRFNQVLL